MKADTRVAVWYAVTIAAVLLALTPLTTLWDRDEPRFAQAAVEMLASGKYLAPTFNGEWRVQKPPLVTWLMTVSMAVFGPSGFSARFWSPIGIAVAAFATWTIGRRLWSSDVGLIAMIVLALTPLTWLEGVAATADAVLLAAITTALAIGVRMMTRRPTWRDGLAMGLALGAGLLTKGPVALVLPIGILGIVIWTSRQEVGHARSIAITTIGAGGVAVGMFALWAVPASAATSGLVVERGLILENLGRFMTAMEGHGTPVLLAPLYYPAVILVGFLPWSVRLPAAARYLRAADGSLRRTFLSAWVLLPLVLFTFAATKLPHYVLPLWPALSLAVAAMLAAGGGQAARQALARRAALVSIALVVGAMVAAPALESLKPAPRVARAVRASGIGGPLFAYGFEEPSLIFYSGRPLVMVPSASALVAWAAQPAAGVLVTTRERVRDVESHAGPLGLVEIAAHTGWNYVKGERLELVAFARARKP
jgi:4-amino-4-deoxy-L-arabinose transferase-like glycosyltransferase